MPDPSKLLLLDFFHLAFLLLGFGLMAYALIRRSNPLIRWHEHGNVWTQPFLKVDLLVFVLVTGSFYAMIRYSVEHDGAPGTAKMSELDSVGVISLLLSNFVMYGMLVGGVLFVVLYVRRVDIVELFGLSRLSPQRIFNWSIGMMIITLPIVLIVSFGWATLLYRIKLKGVKSARIPLAGTRKKFHKTRRGMTATVGAWEACLAAQHAKGVREVEFSWVLETNKDLLGLADIYDCDRYKTYRVYEKDL